MRDDVPGAPLVPIPTPHNGIMYRSRTEARWAVFFTAAEIEFQYEPEGFNLGGIKYLPDFWLPNFRLFVEVKPPGEPSSLESEKCDRLAKASGSLVLLVRGDPGLKRGVLFTPDDAEVDSAEYDLGVPNAFFSICRRCPRILLAFEWQEAGAGIAWGERPLYGPCERLATVGYCHDRINHAGSGFERAIQAAVEFRWQPPQRSVA